MNNSHTFTLPAVSHDFETALFARVVALVMSWPCPKCGQPGLCNCFDDAPRVEQVVQNSERGQTGNLEASRVPQLEAVQPNSVGIREAGHEYAN